jgi:hypothetical protein
VHHVDPCGLLEELGGEVRRRPNTRGAEVDLARIGLGVGDQLLHVLGREIHIGGEDQRRNSGERHRDEVLRRIERELALVQGHVRGIAGDHGQHRVAVGCGLRHEVGAEDAVGSGPIVDHDRLAERARHLLRDHAGDDIGDAAAGVGHHPADRLVRITLCLHNRGEREQDDGKKFS